jgi:hypothetical protein
MDSCEEHVITECWLYFLSEERKLVTGKTGLIRFFEHKRRKENFTLSLEVWKGNRKKISEIF